MSQFPESDRLGDFPHPRETRILIGQGDAERALFEAFMSNRLHHAWLLTGSQGIGKATLAYRFAKFVQHYDNPERAEAFRATGLDVPDDSGALHQIEAQSHPGLLILHKPYDEKTKKFKSVIPVDEVRRLTPFFGMSSGGGGYRICIVDSVDDMNASSANALLKMLEEPPQRSLFMLISHQPGRLLPTVRSRCRTLALKPLSQTSIEEILGQNHAEIRPEEAIAVAALSEGSAGRALTIAAGGGLALYQEMIALLKTLPALDVQKLHALGDRIGRATAAAAFDTFMELLHDWLQKLVRAGAGLSPGPEIVPGEHVVMQKLLGGASLEQWVQVWEKIGHAIAQAGALNTDRKLVILNAFSWLEASARASAMGSRMVR